MARRLFSLMDMIIIVLLFGIHLATLRALLVHEPFFGFGTIYSQGYTDDLFMSLRAGMSCREVEAVMGRPLRKVAWNQHMGPHDEEMWLYSDQANKTANLHRRWVLFKNRKAVVIISDFWED